MEAAAGDKEVSRPSATPEEEALKRSTDCVYFLASPLTCKKGVECEYRHSEGARVNPRDCWYWLNGNCLNLKCSFRHPPLDGLIGTVTTPSGTAPPAQPAIPTHAYSSATQNPNKQNVPCYYFQKGICLKGDRCPFVHGVSPIASPVLQQSRNFGTLATEPSQPVKKTTWSLEKCTTQNIPKETVPQPVAAADSLVRPVARADTAPGNGSILKNNVHNAQQNAELPSRLERSNAPSSGGNASTRPRDKPCQPESVDHLQNDREGDEFLRESSPGFDVLVDDEIEDAEYFHDEDKFKGTSSHGGGRRLNPVDDYDNHCDTDYYDTVDKLDREPYNEIGEYGRHAPVNDRYAREHRRASSERMLEKSSVSDRRRRREDSSSEIDGSDLRHQLKQRRLNGSRPAANSDRHELYWRDERYAEEPRYSAPVHRGDQRHASREGSISKRLQGRITLPGRNSADSKNSIHSDREIDRGRSHGRSSPGKPTNHQGRLHDRINWQKHDGFSLDENRSGSQSTRRDETGTLDFAGPKRLSELKGSKGSEQKSVGSNYSTLSREQRDMKLRKALGGHQESEPVQFEGPKPLSVILKRKREAAPENSAGFGDEGKGKDKVESPMTVAASGTQNYHSSESEGKGDQTLNNSKSFDATALDEEEEEEGLIPVDDVEQHFQSSEKDVHEMEDGTVEYDMEDPELEGYEQGDEEYYYEENEGEEYKTEDADTLYVEDEDEVQEVDDGDEFEKKLGAMLN